MERNIKKRAAFLIILLLLLLALCTLPFFRNSFADTSSYTAYVYQDGELLLTIPLEDPSSDGIYHIETTDNSGSYNDLEVTNGTIRVMDADCPDQICVKQGAISDSLLPITCLPHGLVIELKKQQDTDTPDALTH